MMVSVQYENHEQRLREQDNQVNKLTSKKDRRNLYLIFLQLSFGVMNFIVVLIQTLYSKITRTRELSLASIQIILCLLHFFTKYKNRCLQIIIELSISIVNLEIFIYNRQQFSSFILIYSQVLHSILDLLNSKTEWKHANIIKYSIVIQFAVRVFLDGSTDAEFDQNQIIENVQMILCVIFIVFIQNQREIGNQEDLIQEEQKQEFQGNNQNAQNPVNLSFQDCEISKNPILFHNKSASNRVIKHQSSPFINCLQVPQISDRRNVSQHINSQSVFQSYANQSYLESSNGSSKNISQKRIFPSIQKIEKLSSNFLRNINMLKPYSKESFESDILSQLYIGVMAIDYKRRLLYSNTLIRSLTKNNECFEILDELEKIHIINSKSERNLKTNQQNGIDLSYINFSGGGEDEVLKQEVEEENSKLNRQITPIKQIQQNQQEDLFRKTVTQNTQAKGIEVTGGSNVSLDSKKKQKEQRKSIYQQKKNFSLYENIEKKDDSFSSCSSSEEAEEASISKKMKKSSCEGSPKIFKDQSIKNKENSRISSKSYDANGIQSIYGKLVRNEDLSSNAMLIQALKSKDSTIKTIIDILLDRNYWKDNWKKFIIHSDTELNILTQKLLPPNFQQSPIKVQEQGDKFSYKIKGNSITLQVTMKTNKGGQEKPFCLKLGSYLAEKAVDRRNSNNHSSLKIRMILLIELIPLQDILSSVQESDINNFKNRIISSLSHELRTPLNCAIQMLEILQQSDNCVPSSQINQTSNINALNSPKSLLHQQNFLVSEDVKKMFITPALNSSYLLLSMINDIIDFAQINSGKLSLSFCSFSVRDLVKECVQLFTLPATVKNLQLLLTIDPSIPPVINSDSNRIKQVLLALLSNALKFTEKGFIQVSLTQIQPDLTRITVSDSGCGIPSELRSRIFRGLSSLSFRQTKNQPVIRSSFSGTNQVSKLTSGIVNTSTSIRKSQLGNHRSSHLNPSCLLGEEYSDVNEYLAKREENAGNLQKSALMAELDDQGNINKNNMNTQGAGLGLTIANHLSQGLGGNKGIQVESELNKGSTFHFYIVNHSLKAKGLRLNQRNAFDISYQIWKSIQSDHNSVLSTHSLLVSNPPPNKGQTIGKINDPNQEDQHPSIYEALAHDNQSQNSYYQSNKRCVEEEEEDDEMDEEEEEEGFHKKIIYTDTDSCNIQPEIINQLDEQYEPDEPKYFSVIVTQKKSTNNTVLSPTQISTNTESYKLQGNKMIFKQIDSKASKAKDEQGFSNVDLKQLANLANQANNNPSYPSYTYDREIMNLQDNFRTFLVSSFSQLQSNLHIHSGNSNSNSMSLNQINQSNLFRQNQSESNSSLLQSITYNQYQKKIQPPAKKNQRNSYTNSKSSVDHNKDKRKSVDAMNFVISQEKNFSESNLPNRGPEVSQESLDPSYDIQQQQMASSRQEPQQSLTTQQKLQYLNSIKQCTCNYILIVDDNDFNLMALEMRLQRQYSFQVDKASSGNQAIELVKKRLFESNCCKIYTLIFMDIDMPVKNGHQTAKEILKIFKDKNISPPIISACTAYVQEVERQKARQSGMEYYITKPVETIHLENVLSQVFLSTKK